MKRGKINSKYEKPLMFQMIEDEGVLGTIHIALGENTRFGGVNKEPLHIDLVQKDAMLELDGGIELIGELGICPRDQLNTSEFVQLIEITSLLMAIGLCNSHGITECWTTGVAM